MAQVTYFGHSCFLVETKGKRILFDPFITPNELAKEINLDSIFCDYIFITHGHNDHIADWEYFATKTGAKIVSSFEICTWIEKRGYANTHSMNLGGDWDFGFAKARMVYAAHSNSLPDGSYGGTAAGFVFENNETCFYYAGDTGLNSDMKLIADSFSLDFAFLPIGSNYTMNATDATKAASFINCKQIIGMHYDTFGYIKINHQEAIAEFESKGLALALMNIGESKIF